jgi:RNA-directed DNA polymerase
MKTYRNLYASIIDWDNLMLAWRKARRGKRYTPAAAAFERALDRELPALQRELAAECYQPGAYRSFLIHEPKRRKISAAPFRDRVVHHALCNVIEPVFERRFIADSFANRRGKGSHRALDRCTHFMRRHRYVMHLDVQQFFPGIDHALLKGILTRTVACRPTLALCDRIIDSGRGLLANEYDMMYFAGDDLFASLRPRGLPIGNLTSQFWANVYLNELDQFVKHRLKARAYLRYVDDMLLFADDKAALHCWRGEIIERLASLRLTLHEQRAQPRPVENGVTFLGFVIFPDHRRLKRRKGIAYQRHLKSLAVQYRAGEIEWKDVNASVQSWIGHVSHGDTWGLRRSIFSEVRF